jgi:hypothetical protein
MGGIPGWVKEWLKAVGLPVRHKALSSMGGIPDKIFHSCLFYPFSAF